MYDYSKLKGKIVEVYGTQERFAEALGVSRATLSQKMRGANMFNQDEIYRTMLMLKLKNPTPYFFTKKVSQNDTL